MTEYTVLLAFIASGMLAATKVIKAKDELCQGIESPTEKACCYHKVFIGKVKERAKTDAKWDKMADANQKMMCGAKIDDSF